MCDRLLEVCFSLDKGGRYDSISIRNRYKPLYRLVRAFCMVKVKPRNLENQYKIAPSPRSTRFRTKYIMDPL